jgi:tetratricopeptide (TPR) repeat protein
MRIRLIVAWLIAFVSIILLASIPLNPNERNNAGNQLYGQGQYEAALLAYQSAQVNAPDQPEAYYNAANMLVEMGQLRAAEAAVQQALLTADGALRAEAYYNLGNIHFQLARYADAVQAYRQSLILNSADEDARYNYELALSRLEPTPTPQEQKTTPDEEETDPESTPTPNPIDQTGPTPTPPLENNLPDEDAAPEVGLDGELSATRSPSQAPMTGGARDIEDVERRLDALQENQRTLREFIQSQATPDGLNIRDW